MSHIRKFLDAVKRKALRFFGICTDKVVAASRVVWSQVVTPKSILRVFVTTFVVSFVTSFIFFFSIFFMLALGMELGSTILGVILAAITGYYLTKLFLVVSAIYTQSIAPPKPARSSFLTNERFFADPGLVDPLFPFSNIRWEPKA